MPFREKLPIVLQFYLDDTRTHLTAIERILTVQSDVNHVLLAAHSIRASSAHMGVPRMVDAVNALEAAIQDRTREAQQDLICVLSQIKSIFDETEKSLQIYAASQTIS